MNDYRRILLVVDLSDDSVPIAERAKAIAGSHVAQITLLHVVEYVPLEPVGETLLPAIQIEGDLVARAKVRLADLAQRVGLNANTQMVTTGSIKAEISRVAQELQSELIVIGSRERHGLSGLLNFTEDTVLHQAPCDVLAVRLH